MREIRTYGATSGDWKRSGEAWIEAPAVPVNCYSPLPLRNRASRRLYKGTKCAAVGLNSLSVGQHSHTRPSPPSAGNLQVSAMILVVASGVGGAPARGSR
jgi:hypothetical protein